MKISLFSMPTRDEVKRIEQKFINQTKQQGLYFIQKGHKELKYGTFQSNTKNIIKTYY